MYDQLVKVLRETDFSDGCPCGAEPLCKGKDCVILQAADAIEELQTYADLYKDMIEESQRVARKVIDSYPRWIPVSERLPEDENHVLAATRNKKENYNIVKAYYCHDMGVWAAGMNSNVTHWMPLPPEPKEEAKGDH